MELRRILWRSSRLSFLPSSTTVSLNPGQSTAVKINKTDTILVVCSGSSGCTEFYPARRRQVSCVRVQQQEVRQLWKRKWMSSYSHASWFALPTLLCFISVSPVLRNRTLLIWPGILWWNPSLTPSEAPSLRILRNWNVSGSCWSIVSIRHGEKLYDMFSQPHTNQAGLLLQLLLRRTSLTRSSALCERIVGKRPSRSPLKSGPPKISIVWQPLWLSI